MIYGLYQSAAGMMVNEYRQAVLANNLANADTVAFKRDVATFAERRRASQAGRRDGPTNELLESLSGGIWLGRTETDFSEAGLVRTDEPLDVALAGPGFLRVATPQGAALTRDGRLMLDASGRLVSAVDGAPILGRGGRPIRLDPQAGAAAVSFDKDGRIYQNGRRVGQLDLVDVADYRALRKLGAGRFRADGVRLVRARAELVPGHVERSGVDPIKELVSLLEAARAYQFNAQMISLQDQSAGRLISVVAA